MKFDFFSNIARSKINTLNSFLNLSDIIYIIYFFQVVRFSPDGALLALGSRDSFIYIYQVEEGATKYSRIGRCIVRLFPSLQNFSVDLPTDNIFQMLSQIYVRM